MTKTLLAISLMTATVLMGGFSISDAYAEVYAYYDGIGGGSDYKSNWIDLTGTHWDFKNIGKNSNHPEFEITSQYDQSTPKLVVALTTEKVFGTLEIEYTKDISCNSGDVTVPYLNYLFTGVVITAFDESSDGGIPEVSTSNSFESLAITYTAYNENPSSGMCGTAAGQVNESIDF
jgi:type VI secretion system Hcp family effector